MQTWVHQGIAAALIAVGVTVAGWGFSIPLSDNSPFLPWVSPFLMSIGLALVVAGVAWLLVAWWVMSKRSNELPIHDAHPPSADVAGLNERGTDAYNQGQCRIVTQQSLSLRASLIDAPYGNSFVGLSTISGRKMLKQYGFYGEQCPKTESWATPHNQGIQHDYEITADGQVALDNATNLMWQLSGSPEKMNLSIGYTAQDYIIELNSWTFAGFTDWRLPTLEEAMSLMEAEPKNGNLFIDPIFDTQPAHIWTGDYYRYYLVWGVYFDMGYCTPADHVIYPNYVRAVRSSTV